MHAGDGDAVFQAHQFGEHLCALDQRDVLRVCFVTSGLSREIAELVTTTSAPATFSARCPMNMVAPSLASRSVTADAFRSEPETGSPCSAALRRCRSCRCRRFPRNARVVFWRTCQSSSFRVSACATAAWTISAISSSGFPDGIAPSTPLTSLAFRRLHRSSY